MAKLEAGDKSSNSLLANVLDMDDDFLLAGGLRSNFTIFDSSLTFDCLFSSETLEIQERGVVKVPCKLVIQQVGIFLL